MFSNFKVLGYDFHIERSELHRGFRKERSYDGWVLLIGPYRVTIAA